MKKFISTKKFISINHTPYDYSRRSPIFMDIVDQSNVSRFSTMINSPNSIDRDYKFPINTKFLIEVKVLASSGGNPFYEYKIISHLDGREYWFNPPSPFRQYFYTSSSMLNKQLVDLLD